MGFEKSFQGEGYLAQIIHKLVEGMRSAAGGDSGTAAEVPVTLRITPELAATQDLNRIEELNRKRFSEGDPYAQRRWSWDSPSDYQNPEEMAQRRWAQFQGMGPVGMLRGMGSFNEKWGGYLEKDEDFKGWLGAAAKSRDSNKFSESIEGLEKAGSKMGAFLAELRQAGEGTPRALAVAQDIKALADSIDKLKQSALSSASAIGGAQGSALASAVDPLAQAALSGQSGSTVETLGFSQTLSPGQMFGLMQNPVGSMGGLAKEALLYKLMQGGAGKGLMAALKAPTLEGAAGALPGGMATVAAGGAAALAGGFYGGWRLQEGLVGDAQRDASSFMDSYSLGAGVGGGFDARGLLWNASRTAYDSDLTGSGINPTLAGRALRSMNIGFGRFNAGTGDRGDQLGFLRTGDAVARSAIGMGVDEGALGGFVGMSIRSGTTSRTQGSVEGLLATISHQLAEAHAVGISSNERLGVIVSFRQQEQARMGFISEGSSHALDDLTRSFDATRNPALMGEAGAGVARAMTSNQNPRFLALAQSMLMAHGRLNTTGEQLAELVLGGKKQVGDMRHGGATDLDIMEDVVRSSGGQAQLLTPMARLLKDGGMSMFQMKQFFGASGFSNAQSFGAINSVYSGRALESGAKDQQTPQTEREREDYYRTMGLLDMSTQVKETTRSLKAMMNFIDSQIALHDTGGTVAGRVWAGVDTVARDPLLWTPIGQGVRLAQGLGLGQGPKK